MGGPKTRHDLLHPGKGVVIRRLWTTETENGVESASVGLDMISSMHPADIQSMSMILESGSKSA